MGDQQFPRYSFLGLFFALVSLILLPPFFGDGAGLIQKLVWLAVLLSMLWLVTHDHRSMLIGGVFALPVLLISGQSLVNEASVWTLGYVFFAIIFMLFILSHLLRFVVVTKRVSGDLIFASLCVYLLIGVIWAYIYLMMEVVTPEAFSIDVDVQQGYTALLRELLYYSYVTLTTLGYGDITPGTPVARSWSAMEAIVGQLYLTVIVARLMGLYISTELAGADSEDSQS
ncbi:MAG: two pore domain potassium channel family protein [Porticoccus sp.]|nr:two pore domain potassium channel family protein [Porticoccus sp.]MBQ0807423.1 two pore domain potassium channel family protein [Porticoccus sp.]